MKKWSHLRIPLYNLSAYLSIGETLGEAYRQLPDKDWEEVEWLPEDDGCKAFFLCNEYSKSFAILLNEGKDRPTMSDIGHEAYHMVDAIMQYIEEAPAWGSEPAAYLSGFIHEWIAAELKKMKVRIRIDS